MSSNQSVAPSAGLNLGSSNAPTATQVNVQMHRISQASAGNQNHARTNFHVSQPSQTPQPSASTNPNARTGRGPRGQTVFRFRSERSNWIAVVAVVSSLILGLVAAVYTAAGARLAGDSKLLAVWEAEKDYQIYCQGKKVAHEVLSADCAKIVDAELGPPPFHDPGVFVHISANIRRLIARSPLANVPGTFANFSFWLIGICGLLAIAEYSFYSRYNAVHAESSGADEMLLKKHQHSTVHLLVLAVRIWILGSWLRAQAHGMSNQENIAMALGWFTISLWPYNHEKAYGGRPRPIWRQIQGLLYGSSVVRASVGFVTGPSEPLNVIILTLFGVASSASYGKVDFDGNMWSGSCSEIGPLWHVHAWYLGRYLSALLGVSFCCYLILGMTLFCMVGYPIIYQAHVMELYLLLGRQLQITCLLIYLVSCIVGATEVVDSLITIDTSGLDNIPTLIHTS